MGLVVSVNRGERRQVEYSDAGVTGIDKRPVDGAVEVAPPGPRAFGETGGSGVAGDAIGDRRYHGGDHQAVYAYAREDLDRWERELGRALTAGVFGENLTTTGVDVNEALIGERWRVGEVLLEVTSCRIPCRTFAGWLAEPGWVKRFTQEGRPGAYFRVVEAGLVRAGDPIDVVFRPEHAVTVNVLFRAMTTEPDLLPATLAAGDALNPDHASAVRRRLSLD